MDSFHEAPEGWVARPGVHLPHLLENNEVELFSGTDPSISAKKV